MRTQGLAPGHSRARGEPCGFEVVVGQLAALDRHPELREAALGREYFQYRDGPGAQSRGGRAVRRLFG